MKYKLIVDKQSKTNPSVDKREYEIDVEELRFKDDVADSLVITVEETYIMRRLSLSEYHVLSVLETPIKEPLGDLNVQLFEGENYIYLMDMTGNKFYAEYIVKNEFNNLYVTNVQMNSAINQSAREVEIKVNQKLTGYSTTQETEAMIDAKADEITLGVKEKISPLTGENSLSNSGFEEGLNNWNTETAGSTTGSVSVQENNNTKYAQIVSKSGWTRLSQTLSGLLKGIEYTLNFNAYDNGDLEIDLEDGIFQVDIFQDSQISEESEVLASEVIYVGTQESSYAINFKPINNENVFIQFSLKNPFSSENTMSVMLSNITLSGGGVNEKIAKLDIKSDEINAKVEKKVDEETVTGAYLILKINGDTSESKLSADKIELSANDILNLLAGNTINLSSQNIVIASANFNVDKDGNATINNVTINGGNINLKDDGTYTNGKIVSTQTDNPNRESVLYSNGLWVRSDYNGNIGGSYDSEHMSISNGSTTEDVPLYGVEATLGNGNTNPKLEVYNYVSNVETIITPSSVTTPTVSQTSLESIKKNIEKFENGLDIVKNSEIYTYNLKSEQDTDKKHIGFVIGDKYKTPKEVMSQDGQAIDTYSMISVLWKTVQELNERIERLEANNG